MTLDPMGLAAGDPNMYGLEGNNPVNFVDPSGLDPSSGDTISIEGLLAYYHRTSIFGDSNVVLGKVSTVGGVTYVSQFGITVPYSRIQHLDWDIVDDREALKEWFKNNYENPKFPQANIPEPISPIDAGIQSVTDSTESISKGLAVAALEIVSEFDSDFKQEAEQLSKEAYEQGEFGQTEDAPDWIKYGTRGSAVVASVAVAAAIGLDLTNPGTESLDYPKPPGWNENWEWGPGSGESEAGWRWWDPDGGEWRWHEVDRWHPEGHWDFNPWDNWNSRWQNVPVPPAPQVP
jgi:hypothetical protein